MTRLTLGELIRRRRKELNWTQSTLAERIGVGTSYINKIENGHQLGSYKVLAKISSAMKLPWSEMYNTGEIEVPDIDDIDEYMTPVLDSHYKTLHPTVKEILYEIAPILEKYI